MASVAFKRGLVANLPATYSEGTFYVTTDERAIYLDISDSARIRLGDFQEFATIAELEANVNPSTSALYYVTGANVLAKWNGSAYVQINPDTGATSVSVEGTGNAVTAASYDADTRTITLTMGETFAKQSDLDTIQSTIDGIVSTGGEANVIDTVKVNGTALPVTDKAVDVTITSGSTDGTISVNGEEVAVAGLGSAAYTDTTDYDAAGAADSALDSAKTYTDDAIAALDSADVAVAGQYVTSVSETDGIITVTRTSLPDYSETYDAYGAADAVASDLASEISRATAAEETAQAAAETAQATADAKVASVTAGDASITIAGTTTAPTVAVSISADADNALSLTTDGLKVVVPDGTDYSVTVTESSSDDYAKVYTISQLGSTIGTINVPKDMVVSSGTVTTLSASDGTHDAGTYLVLTLANSDNTEIWIPADALIEYVTGDTAADGIITTSVDSDYVLTATINDGTITLAKLATSIQTSLGKADTAVQSVTSGTTDGTISVDGTDVAVTGLGSAAYTDASAYDAAGTAATEAASALEEAKSYADEAIEDAILTWLDF